MTKETAPRQSLFLLPDFSAKEVPDFLQQEPSKTLSSPVNAGRSGHSGFEDSLRICHHQIGKIKIGGQQPFELGLIDKPGVNLGRPGRDR
jgi:hypothetical protein